MNATSETKKRPTRAARLRPTLRIIRTTRSGSKTSSAPGDGAYRKSVRSVSSDTALRVGLLMPSTLAEPGAGHHQAIRPIGGRAFPTTPAPAGHRLHRGG